MSEQEEQEPSPEQSQKGNINLDPQLVKRLEAIGAFLGDDFTVDVLVNSAVQAFVDGIDDKLNED